MSISNIIAGVIVGSLLLAILVLSGYAIYSEPVFQFMFGVFFGMILVFGIGAWAINHLLGDR